MTDNKGIFGFLKSWGGSDSEEENQRQYALSKEQDGNTVADSDEHIITSEIEFFVVEKLEKLAIIFAKFLILCSTFPFFTDCVLLRKVYIERET